MCWENTISKLVKHPPINNSLKTLILPVLILTAGLLIRLINLTNIPIFVDEAIYIRWAQVMRAESTLRFLPLSDGKQPLFMWLTMLTLKLFQDPLVAGRTVSVLAGTASILGVGVLSFLLFQNIKISLWTGIFLAFSPFSFFFDRMALVDSLLTACGIWTFIFSIAAAKYKRLDLALFSGFSLGAALLTKSPAQILIILIPLAYFIFFKSGKNNWVTSSFQVTWLILSTYIVSFGMYNLLRLGPQFHMIYLRNRDYVYPLSEIIAHPGKPLFSNVAGSFSYLSYFLTPPVLIASIFGIIIGIKNKSPVILLGIIALTIFLSQNLVAKVITARYFLILIPYLIILAVYFLFHVISKLKIEKIKSVFFLALFSIWPFWLVSTMLISPQSLNLPRSEKSGYFELWTAGHGIKEVSEYLKKQEPRNQPVLVGTEGYFGTLPDGLQMYLNDRKNIRIIGIGLYPDKVPQPLSNSLLDNKVYLVINDSRFSISDPPAVGLRLIASFPKAIQPDGKLERLLFFKLDAPPSADTQP